MRLVYCIAADFFKRDNFGVAIAACIFIGENRPVFQMDYRLYQTEGQ